MTRCFKTMLMLAAILAVSFSTDAVAVRKQNPTDQLSQALQKEKEGAQKNCSKL